MDAERLEMDLPNTILNIPSDKKFIKENYDIYQQLNFFNQDGIFEGTCPECASCGKNFLKIKMPELDETGKKLKLESYLFVQESKNRMKSYLEKHIEKEIEIELLKIKDEIEEKVRARYISTKPDLSEEFQSDAC